MISNEWAVARLLSTSIAVIALLAALVAPVASTTGLGPAPPLREVKSWTYWLQSYDRTRLEAIETDMLVVDYSRSDPAGGAMIPFTFDEIASLKRKPDGSRRVVLAYLSIGEAEEYRFYWQPEWRDVRPAWHLSENCRWPRNHLVRFWDQGWKDILYRGERSYLDRIIEAGFDGIYVDRIDIYDDMKGRHPDPRTEIIAFMVEMSVTAKLKRPGFLVVAQNAESLLTSEAYRQAIDALAKEDLLTGVGGSGVRNSADLVAWSKGQLAKLRAKGKALFAVEYLRTQAAIAAARAELEPLGIVSTFATRALDGADPLAPDPPGTEAYGTPEYAAGRCDGVFFK